MTPSLLSPSKPTKSDNLRTKCEDENIFRDHNVIFFFFLEDTRKVQMKSIYILPFTLLSDHPIYCTCFCLHPGNTSAL